MKFLSRVLGGFFLIGALLFSNLAAQEQNVAGKEDAKAVKEKKKEKEPEKKEPEKKEPDKKDAPKEKDEDKNGKKKGEDKEARRKDKKDRKDKDKDKDEERIAYGAKLDGKLKEVEEGSQRNFTLEVMQPDPKKILEFQRWQAEQKIGIAQSRDPNDIRNRTINFKREYAQRLLNLNSPVDVKLRAGDAIRVGSRNPPLDYDEKGNLKRWTSKQLNALKAGSKVPGYYPAEWKDLRPGQLVSVYLAKPEKKSYVKKKFVDDEDLLPKRPEAVMITINLEPPPR